MLYFPGRYLYGSGFRRFRRAEYGRSLDYLREQGLVFVKRDASGWICTLTAAGRQRLDRGVDPERRWKRKWDGKWRQVVFDIPVPQQPLRHRLLYWLRANRFGYLQDSVWVSPDPLEIGRSTFRDLRAKADMAVFMESRVMAAASNSAIVEAAWDLFSVHRAYQRHGAFLAQARKRIDGLGSPAELGELLVEERRLWEKAVDSDPLLPKPLWPRGYDGPSALKARNDFFLALRKRAAAAG